MKKNAYRINWNRFTAFIMVVYTILLSVIFWVVSLHTKEGEFMLQVTLWAWVALTGLLLLLVNKVFCKDQE